MRPETIRGAAGLAALLAFLLIALAACSHLEAGESHPFSRISKEQLKAQLGAPGTLVIDVRSKRDWEASSHKIPGAVRQEPSSGDLSWAAAYSKDRPITLYCA